LLGFVSHHQQVALILTGVNGCEPIYSRTGESGSICAQSNRSDCVRQVLQSGAAGQAG
jgi:hypothetical protein